MKNQRYLEIKIRPAGYKCSLCKNRTTYTLQMHYNRRKENVCLNCAERIKADLDFLTMEMLAGQKIN